MSEQKEEIAWVAARVLLVTSAEPSVLEKKMTHDLSVPFPLLLDLEKGPYRRWGLGKTNVFGAMVSPDLNVRYFRLLIKGERFLSLAPHMLQLGGDFVIDPQERISFAHAMTNNGDRPDTATLLSEPRRAAGPGFDSLNNLPPQTLRSKAGEHLQ